MDLLRRAMSYISYVSCRIALRRVLSPRPSHGPWASTSANAGASAGASKSSFCHFMLCHVMDFGEPNLAGQCGSVGRRLFSLARMVG